LPIKVAIGDFRQDICALCHKQGCIYRYPKSHHLRPNPKNGSLCKYCLDKNIKRKGGQKNETQ